MAFGEHQLILAVRATNQASGLLSRVSRDFRRLQAMKSVDVQRSRISNQMAANALQMQAKMAKIQSTVAANGKNRIAYEQAVARNQLQQLNIANRITNLDIRRSSIDRARAGLEVQRLRLLKQETDLEARLESIELRRQAINNQMGRIGTQMLGKQNQLERLGVSQLNARAQVLERQVAYNKANSQYMKAVSKGGPVAGTNVAFAREAADLRLQASRAHLGTFPGQQRLLESQMGDLAANVEQAKKSLKGLDFMEQGLARTSAILTERYNVLATQLANVDARDAAAAGTEAELNKQLLITKRALDGVNAARVEQLATAEATAAALQIDIEKQRLLAGAYKDTNAAMAEQKTLQTETTIRGIGHIGRVLGTAGLIGVAAFGAMGASAAHFNQEAVRAATQTGKIGSNANVVVANAGRIEKAIEGIMTVIPANQHDMTDALYNIYSSMNTTFGQGTKLLKLFGQVWVAGGMTGNINDVSDALITLGNNWGISAKDMGAWKKLAASTLATVRFGRLSVEQYTQTMNQLAPAFHGANQSIEEMNAAIAFQTRLMPSQRMSAASLARLMQLLQRLAANPKPGFEEMAKQIVDVHGNLLPLHKVLQIIIADMNKMHPGWTKNTTAISQFFKEATGTSGNIQAQRAWQTLIQRNDLYQKTLFQTTSDQKEFNRSLKAMEQSTGVKWQQFINDMRVLGLELGSVVLPAMLAIVSPLVNLAKWFNNLSDSTKRFYGEILAGGAAVAFILGFVASLTAALIFGQKNIKIAGQALGIIAKDGETAAASLGTLSAEAGFATTRVALLLGKATLLGTAFYLIQSQTHDLNKTMHIFSYVILGAAVIKLVSLTKKLIEARNAMIGLQLATAGEIGALILISYELAKLIDSIPGVDKGIRNLFQDSDVTINTTREHIREMRLEVEKMPDWAQKGLTPKIDAEAALQNLGKLQAAFKNVPKWAIAHIHVILDKRELAQVQQQMNKFVQNIQPLPGTTDVGMPRAQVESRLAAMFPFLDSKTIDKMTNQAYKSIVKARSQFTEELRRANFGAIPKGIAGQTTAALTDKEFQAAATRAAKLQRAMTNALTPQDYERAWLSYNNYVTKVTNQMTKQQKALFQDLMNFIISNTNMGATVSDAVILGMQRKASQLEDIFNAAPTTKNWRAWQKELDKISKLGTQNQVAEASAIVQQDQQNQDARTQAAKEAADKRKQIAKDEADKIKQIQQQAQQQIQSGVSNLMSIYQQSLQQYQGYLGQIFQGPFMQSAIMQNRQQFGFSARPQDFVRDAKEAVTHAERFQGSLDRLRKRITPVGGSTVAGELTQQIAQLGPDAQKQLDVVGRMSAAQFKEWVGYFKRGQQDAKAQAKKDLDARLKEWMKFGKSVALAIATGIRSEDVALENAMRRMFERMFPGVKLRAGPGGGKTLAPGGKRTNIPTTVSETVHYHVHAGEGMGWESALRRAHFQQKNRKK